MKENIRNFIPPYSKYKYASSTVIFRGWEGIYWGGEDASLLWLLFLVKEHEGVTFIVKKQTFCNRSTDFVDFWVHEDKSSWTRLFRYRLADQVILQVWRLSQLEVISFYSFYFGVRWIYIYLSLEIDHSLGGSIFDTSSLSIKNVELFHLLHHNGILKYIYIYTILICLDEMEMR